jgi:hypothetical protein
MRLPRARALLCEGERHLSHQGEIVAELERHGRGHTRTANGERDGSVSASQCGQLIMILAIAMVSRIGWHDCC